MTEPERSERKTDPSSRAYELLGHGDVEGAIAHLSQALEHHPEAELHQLLAQLHYFSGGYEAARQHLEAAFRKFRDGEEPTRAARAAMELADIHLSILGNQAASSGWLARARRLLESVGDCVEWGYLEVAVIACERPDAGELERSAARALRVAAAFNDPDLEIRALADSGLALVSQGRLREGFARLDEALALISAGEARQADTAARSFCSLLSSCDRAGDLRRAEEWNRLIEALVLVPNRGRPPVLAAHCRLVYGSVLSSAGRWDEAEELLVQVLGPAGEPHPHRVETIARLAELRLHQGRVDEAAALVRPYEDRLAMCLPLARLHLVRGETAGAVAVAERGLRDLIGDLLRGGPLLGVLVEAHLQQGDLDAATRAAERLDRLAVVAESAALRGDAALARGRVAQALGHPAEAVELIAAACRHVEGEGKPLQLGLARLALAEAHAQHGDAASAVIEAQAAFGLFDGLGASGLADRGAALLRSLGASVRVRPDDASGLAGLSRREAEVLDLVRQGLSNPEIARRLFISAKTAEHHVGRVLTKLGVRTRAEAAGIAAAALARGDAPLTSR